MSDETLLIEDALKGDSHAFGQLVDRYQERLYCAMLNVVQNPHEAEDVVQEAFIQAYVKLDTFQQNSRFFTWLYRIAFNNALTRRRRYRGELSVEQSREVAGNEPADPGESPDDPMIRDERVSMIRTAMNMLSEDHRVILTLREMQEMSYESIAEILEIEVGTVRSRLSRARNQLRVHLESLPGWS